MPYFATDRDVFVANFPFALGESDLRALAEPYGEVVRCRIAVDRGTGSSRGFGFVRFLREEEARAAIAALNGSIVQGRVLVARAAEPNGTPDADRLHR